MQLKYRIFLALAAANFSLAAQQIWRLDQCLDASATAQPLAAQRELIAESNRAALQILNRNNWPQASLGGQATWQTAVTSLPITLPPGLDVPTLSKDQYRFTLELLEPIWDGGQNARQKTVQNAQNAAEQQKLVTDLWATREQVLQLFCAAVLAEKQAEILAAGRADLVSRKNRLAEMVKNGTAIESNIQNVEARLLETEQQNDELDARRNAARAGLALLTGLKIGASDRLEITGAATYFDGAVAIERPEIGLFEAQKQALFAQQKLVGAKNLPRINAIATLGYARPGLNFLSNEFDPYAIFGLNFKWNLTNFYTKNTDSERQTLQIQAQRLDAQRQQFELATNVRAQNQRAEIIRLEKIAAKDAQILGLRRAIAATAEVQVENGVLTESEFLTEKTAETNAQLNASLHEIQLAQARLIFNFIVGKN